MSFFKPTSEERDTLKKAVARFAHDPVKSQLLSRLDAEDAEFSRSSEEWNHLNFCVEQHHLHAQTELRRDPKKKSAKRSRATSRALKREGHSAASKTALSRQARSAASKRSAASRSPGPSMQRSWTTHA